MNAVIQINQLTRCFNETTAVDQLSLEVHAGEIFGFLGHNGAGKTTTVRLLNGVIEPNSSSMRVLGLVLMTLYNSGLGVVLSYALLRSDSVLLSASLHAINHLVLSILMLIGFPPFDSAFSFGLGIHGIATLAIVALLIPRDPICRGRGSNLAQSAPAPVDMALSKNPGAVKKVADQASLGGTS